MNEFIDEDVTVPTYTHLAKETGSKKFVLTEKYKFVKHGFFYSIISFLLFWLAFIIFYPITHIAYGLKVKGKKNLKGVKNAVFVSNHVLDLDFISLLSHALASKRPYLLTTPKPFTLPVARLVARPLRAIPVTSDTSPTITKNFLKSINGVLSNGKSLLIFPEGSMWQYYNKIRPFMSGAFRFSCKNNVPIVPIVATYRKPSGLYKAFGRKKPLVTYYILPPIYPNDDSKEEIERLKNVTHDEMKKTFETYSTYTSFISAPVSKILKTDRQNADGKE